MASRHAQGGGREKTITVQVLHKDGEERVFTLETGEAYLGAVLTAEGVVRTTRPLMASMLSGPRPWTRGQEWWKLTQGRRNGQQAATAPPLPTETTLN